MVGGASERAREGRREGDMKILISGIKTGHYRYLNTSTQDDTDIDMSMMIYVGVTALSDCYCCNIDLPLYTSTHDLMKCLTPYFTSLNSKYSGT